MARQQWITGDNIDEKFTKINTILMRLARRTKQYGVVATPRIPLVLILDAPREDGFLGKILIPVSGTIRKAYLDVETVTPKTRPKLTVKLKTATGSMKEAMVYRQGLNIMERDIPVTAGSVITLSTSLPENVQGLALGLVLDVAMSDVTKKAFLQEEILADLEAQDAGAAEEGEA